MEEAKRKTQKLPTRHMQPGAFINDAASVN